VRVLEPGKPVVSSVSWAGRTSHPGCGGTRQAIAPGSYQLVGKLGQLTSGPAPFALTGAGDRAGTEPQGVEPKQGVEPNTVEPKTVEPKTVEPNTGGVPKVTGPKPGADSTQAATDQPGQPG
jgi:hypothetical protein